MRRVIVVLCLINRASLEMRTAQRLFISRKARSTSTPIKTDYAYSNINYQPVFYKSFRNLHNTPSGVRSAANNPDLKIIVQNSSKYLNENNSDSNVILNKKPLITANEATSNKLENKVWSEKDAPEKLKFAARNLKKGDSTEFHLDDEDVRTVTKNAYDIWPLFYHAPYDYEPMKIDVQVEKAVEKRFVIPRYERVIPVHELVEDNADSNSKYSKIVTTDNPIFGNQPFFSYILNDYFDKTDEEDPISFKGLPWGKEFDHEIALHDIDEYAKRIRRLEGNPKLDTTNNTYMFLDKDIVNEPLSNYESRDESEINETGNGNKYKHDNRYKYNGDNYIGFKDFADSFATRFGFEDYNKDSKYSVKNNGNKGEKRNGYRNVYHKDEYKENYDFFDSSDKSENDEQKGASKFNIAGSEAILHSQTAVALDENEINNAKYNDANFRDKQQYNETDKNLSEYRDIAKNTALSNNADYVERYTINE